MIRLLSILLVFFCLVAQATNWYVDCNAVGLNNGTSWANAWNNISNIVWSSLNGGDTVNISGGTYWSGTVINYDKGGTYGNPILLKASQEVGHDSKVIMYGGFAFSKSYLSFDGSKSDTHTITNTLQTLNVPTNCNWLIQGYYPGFCTNSPFYAVGGGDGGTGLNVKWIEVVCDIPRHMIPDDWPGYSDYRTYGTAFNFGDSVVITNTVVNYCWIHDCAWNGFTRYGGGGYYGMLDAAYLLMENLGQDYFEHSGGWDIHHCIMHGSKRTVGHQDGIVINDGYSRVYNNIMYDLADTIAIYPTLKGVDSGHIAMYGNVLYYSQWDDSDDVSTVLNVTAEDGWTSGTNWNNFFFFNNTIHVTNKLIGGCASVVNTKYPATLFKLTNWWHFNNLYVSSGVSGNAGFGGDGTNYPAGTGTIGDEAEIKVDYNTIAGIDATTKVLSYRGTNYATADDFNLAVMYKSNSSAFPAFNAIMAHDYRLTVADTAAKGRGTNLTDWAASLPGLNYDIYGNKREAAGAWDIGAIVYTASPLAFPAVPTGLSASQGTYSNAITLSWNAAANANYYQVWRYSNANYSVIATRISEPQYTSTSFTDTVPVNTTNYYWILGEREGIGWSLLSSFASGYSIAGGGSTNLTSTSVITNGLLLRLTFDDLVAGGEGVKVTDLSPAGGHDMYFFGFPATPTNWPTRVSCTNGLTLTPYAAQFNQDYGTGNDGHPYGMFGGITNIDGLIGLTQATICAWARYFAQPSCDPAQDQNASIIDAGYGTNATWLLGRFYSYGTRFTIFTNTDYQTDGPLSVYYPDIADAACMDTSNYHHYAATVDLVSGIIKSWYNASNCYTRDIGTVATNLWVPIPETGGSFAGSNGWISVGCHTHVGSPTLTDGDGFPNSGWMNGQVADVRIYNRVLSSNEIYQIYSGLETNPVTPAAATTSLKVGTFLINGKPIGRVVPTP